MLLGNNFDGGDSGFVIEDTFSAAKAEATNGRTAMERNLVEAILRLMRII